MFLHIHRVLVKTEAGLGVEWRGEDRDLTLVVLVFFPSPHSFKWLYLKCDNSRFLFFNIRNVNGSLDVEDLNICFPGDNVVMSVYFVRI